MIPARPKKQMADAAAKYAHNNAHTRHTPFLLMEYSELSHSLSGSHLNDHPVPSSRAASTKLKTAPNDEITDDVILLERKNISSMVEDWLATIKEVYYYVVSCPSRTCVIMRHREEGWMRSSELNTNLIMNKRDICVNSC